MTSLQASDAVTEGALLHPVIPTQRSWKFGLAISLVCVTVVAACATGFLVWKSQHDAIVDLRGQRQALRNEIVGLNAKAADLGTRLTTSRNTLTTTKAKLAKSVKSYAKAKTNLTKLSRDLVAAKKLAAANWNSGYVSGQSAGYSSGQSAGYSSGNNDGYATGHEAGVYDASDELTCSDDATVTWLPYCG